MREESSVNREQKKREERSVTRLLRQVYGCSMSATNFLIFCNKKGKTNIHYLLVLIKLIDKIHINLTLLESKAC